MPSAITWEGGTARLRQGLLSLQPSPSTTHRLDVLPVQFATVGDHGVNSVSQAGSLHIRVPDEHKVLQDRAEAARQL